MKDWIEKLHGFLQLNDRSILEDAGSISHDLAKEIAEREYDSFSASRNLERSHEEDDFERVIKSLPSNKTRGRKS